MHTHTCTHTVHTHNSRNTLVSAMLLLQAQFGLGLKDAASNLGICATTLKRACRRHGVRRWPRRQIAKLNKALTQV